jgi:hypothetical protein
MIIGRQEAEVFFGVIMWSMGVLLVFDALEYCYKRFIKKA